MNEDNDEGLLSGFDCTAKNAEFCLPPKE